MFFLSERPRRWVHRAMREQLPNKSVRCYTIRFEPGLRIDCAVDVAVLDTCGVKLEVQVCAECAPRLAHATDDLPSLHSLAGAIREVAEELGLQLPPGCFSRFNRLYMHGLMQDIWFADVSAEAAGEPAPGPEVADWRWAHKAEIEQMAGRGEFFAYSYLSTLPH